MFDKIDSGLFNKVGKVRFKFMAEALEKLRKLYISHSINKCIKSIIKYVRTIEQHPHLSDVKQILEVIRIQEKLNDLVQNKENGKYYEDVFYRMIVSRINEDYKKDLDNLIAALGKYLYEYVSKIKIKKTSLDIKSFVATKVISFNYTKTYEKEYEKECENICCNFLETKYDYVHGKIGHDYKGNNIVLGIDEYLLDEKKI